MALILDKIQKLNKYLNLDHKLTQDTFSYNFIKHLLPEELTYSSSSIRLSSLHLILNDIIINDKKSIIEFGSGISTFAIASLLSKRGRGKFVSVEGSQAWADFIEDILKMNDLQDYVEIVVAPVKTYEGKLFNAWYTESIIKERIVNKTFDQVIIDGPEAYQEVNKYNRFNAFPFIFSYLSKEQYSVFLDDSNREGEKYILKEWEREYSLSFKIFSNSSIAYATHGNNFNFLPFEIK